MEHLRCGESKLNNPYRYRPQIEQQLLLSLPVDIAQHTHTIQVIRTAANILKLNMLQCALLGWLLKRSSSSLTQLVLSAHTVNMTGTDQNRALLLLILLNAYHVKSFLNKTTQPIIDAEVIKMVPNFGKIYNSWRPQSMLKDASLVQLNETFSKWGTRGKKVKPDYNKLVNRILQLSKTYNVGGNEQQMPKKKVKINQEQQHHHQQQKVKKAEIIQQQIEEQQRNYMNKSNSMMLRSSKIQSNHNNFANIYDEQDHNDGFINSNAYTQHNPFLSSNPLLNNNSMMRRSTRFRRQPFFFDLQHSLGAGQFASQQLNNTILRSTYRMGNDNGGRSLLFSNLKRTASNDIIKE